MKRYYPDANFLTAFLYSNHEHHLKASEILTDILNGEENLVMISTLTFDETWMSLHRCSEEGRIKSFSAFSDDMEDIYNSMRQDQKIQIIETVNPPQLIDVALKGSKKFNLRPRDSSHYAYVKVWDAELLSFDSDFEQTDIRKVTI